MDVYLVGGAVRDELLGRPVAERDWVVVGSTPEEMLRLGFRQVGRDFPVFLHPDTAEEHALARTERKSGPGHTGFVCHAGPEVTLEEDLQRRDLTVNAMARDRRGRLVDPFCGERDLQARVLRHVSDAFVEDPLRVFRVARFAAQLPGFQVAAETLELMRRMSAANALAELSAERVWQELHKALASAAPARFFRVLEQAAALDPWLTELAGAATDFPETLPDPARRFGALAWALTAAQAEALGARLKVPKRFRHLAVQVAEHGRTLARWRATEPDTLLQALTDIGALRAQRDPGAALDVVEERAGVDLRDLRELIERLTAIDTRSFRDAGLNGAALGAALREARLALIERAAQAH